CAPSSRSGSCASGAPAPRTSTSPRRARAPRSRSTRRRSRPSRPERARRPFDSAALRAATLRANGCFSAAAARLGSPAMDLSLLLAAALAAAPAAPAPAPAPTAAAAPAAAPAAPRAAGRVLDRLAATVNGEPVTLVDLEERAGSELLRVETMQAGAAKEQARAKALKIAFDNVIAERLLDGQAAALGVEIGDPQV